MIDTIRVKFPIAPTEEQLKIWWTGKSTRKLTGMNTFYVYNPPARGTKLRFTYYPVAYNDSEMLTLEVSLPKLVLGNNYQMLESIDEAIKTANLALSKTAHIPRLDLSEGILIRLDMCYNHQVGDAVDDYIKALGNLDYPHRRTKHHRNEGVEYRAKHKTTKFYNKENESGFKEAHGILRQEITLINSKDIRLFLDNPKPTLLDVTPEKIADELRNELTKLGLLNNSIANQDTALKKLCEKHGELAGTYYYGLLINKTNKSKKRIVGETNLHPRCLDRRLRKIRVDTGIPLTLTDREEPLPPLEINL
jgi:hypothetical protein